MGFLEQKIASQFLTALKSLSIVFFVVSCSSSPISELPYYNTPDFTPLFLTEKEAAERVSHTIPSFVFLDQNKNVFSSKTLENKIHVANFIFTTCSGICPNMTSNMKIAENAFFNDSLVKILSFSVTPWIDDSKKLLDYASFYQIKSNNWHFLTGDKSKIYDLARRSYFAEEDFGFTKDSTDFLHTEHFILVDQNKKIRGIYNGTLRLEAEQLVKDIAVLKSLL
ncbi:MAG: SCO family protein [Flavobacteriaceae bacterium]|mgnify:CR=1 FL=1|nr:SCO family protein [Flavobacteriaceae bacterium]